MERCTKKCKGAQRSTNVHKERNKMCKGANEGIKKCKGAQKMHKEEEQ